MSFAMKYGMQKRARKSGPCEEHGEAGCMACGGMMAKGGMVDDETDSGYGDMPMKPKDKMNYGAKEEDDMDETAMEDDVDLVDRIMKQHFSKGGRVANDTKPIAGFKENEFDDLVLRDDLESSYTGENSGDELGNDQEDQDRADIISRIMRSRSKKDRMPRPA